MYALYIRKEKGLKEPCISVKEPCISALEPTKKIDRQKRKEGCKQAPAQEWTNRTLVDHELFDM